MRKRCAVLGCNTQAAPGRARCPKHTKQQNRAKNARRDHALVKQRRHNLTTKGGAVCYWCGMFGTPAELQLDHVIELVDGGIDHPTNTAWIHGTPCHTEKTAEARKARE